MSSFSRLFTLEEAKAELEIIRPLLSSAMSARQEILRLRPDLEHELEQAMGNGHSAESTALLAAFGRLRDALVEIQARGVLVKDVGSGLVDFPAEHEGRVVFLCWKFGEPDLTYWHDLDAGFAGRQPL
jgi:hypothetical protein